MSWIFYPNAAGLAFDVGRNCSAYGASRKEVAVKDVCAPPALPSSYDADFLAAAGTIKGITPEQNPAANCPPNEPRKFGGQNKGRLDQVPSYFPGKSDLP